MLRFSANLSTMFREFPVLERPGAAARAGFTAVEMQFPYDLDLNDLAAAITRNNLGLSVLNVPAGDFPQGGEGNVTIAEQRDEFREAVALTRRYAEKLRPTNVNVLAGVPAASRDPEECADTMAENLAFAAEIFTEIGVGVVVEAINDTDWPGFFLTTPARVFDVFDRAGHPNLSMEFDIYHMRMMNLPVVELFEEHVERIGHIQFADAPGRHEPGTGDIDFDAVFDTIDVSDYGGWVAAEYLPAGQTEDGLGWMEKYAG